MRAACVTLLVAIALALPATAVAGTSVQVRHVDFSAFPRLRVTALVPAGARPVLLENSRRGSCVSAQLGSAEALIMAVDNSESMRGRPLREAKECGQGVPRSTGADAGSTGLVAFGHHALPLTRRDESKTTSRRRSRRSPPTHSRERAFYDAVVASAPPPAADVDWHTHPRAAHGRARRRLTSARTRRRSPRLSVRA